MQTTKISTHRTQQGNAIVLTMVYVGLSLLLLATIIGRSSSNAVVTQRNNAYNQAVTAAEAATEAVLAKMCNDFVNQSIDYSNLVPYRALTPSSFLPAGWPAEYEFSDRSGNINRTDVTSTGPSIATTFDGQFAGLYGIVFPFRVTSNAKHLATPFPAGTGHPVEAAVQQDFQLACIPVFQFMCFYTMNLEINPSPQMTLTGKVHGNANIYVAPVTGLEFKGDVGAVGHIYNDREKDDPQYGSAKVAPLYDAAKMESPNVSSLTLPIGTNSGPTQVRQILDPPPLGENPQSPMGQQRYYNQADLIIVTSASGTVSVETGAWNSFTPLVPDTTNGFSFITTSNSFTDQREGKPTLTTDIDVAALNKWMTNSGPKSGLGLNNQAQFQLGHHLNSVYVNDKRVNAAKLTVVRVSNGTYLPSDGLTVATDRPLYVKGNYNAPDLTVGSTDTSKTKPASLIGDAITVLSTNWSDPNSFLGVARTATNTTVNAAFLAGIVETTNSSGTKYYSGGLENFPRFLEDWGNGKTLTYNGSMVVLFPSRYATGFWGKANVYTPPVRKWAFDMNFLNQKKLPPCTPEVRKLLRGQWNVIAANSP